jgi:hypothetical protein
LGRIQLLGRLLAKLIDGEWVGPATAIGEDYQVLEHRGVVETRPSHGGRFSLRLVKREIGELARQVLTQGDAASSVVTFQGSNVTEFRGPEAQREGQRQGARVDADSIAKALATIRMNK